MTPPSGGAGERRPPERPASPKPATAFRTLLESPLSEPSTNAPARERGKALDRDGREDRDADRPTSAALPLVEAPRQPAIRETFAAPASPAAPSVDAAQIQVLAETMLRSLRIGGDGRGGHEARLEIGRGRWAGSVVRLASSGGRVRAEIRGAGPDAEALAERLGAALAERGIAVEDVEIH